MPDPRIAKMIIRIMIQIPIKPDPQIAKNIVGNISYKIKLIKYNLVLQNHI